jgi:putative ubiquitin-RnfH superfamily antitoxin RatB of RatAB toxin-antitoxin module
MSRPKILVQLDPDSHASLFDAVVAVDAGIDQLLQYDHVTIDEVRDLVHGAIFTRGPEDLNNTAIYVGGADVVAGEELLAAVLASFFGPMRVSVMLDANGANTTAVAAVLAAAAQLQLDQVTALVLAGTGPVGQRVSRLLVQQGATVRLASRQSVRAEQAVERIVQQVPAARLSAVETADQEQTAAALEGVQLVIAAGAEGIQLIAAATWQGLDELQVAIDLNAVDPLGIEGVGVMDKAELRDGTSCYGAIGVGGTKMKIHKAALKQLFTSNDQVLDADRIFEIGREL